MASLLGAASSSSPSATSSSLIRRSGESFSGHRSERSALLPPHDPSDEELDVRRHHAEPPHKLKRERASGAAPPEPTLNLTIQPGDTLATIALKYNIPVAELKRVNNLFQDNEFFALQNLKLPLRSANSVRTELLPDSPHPPTAATGVPGWLVDHWSSPVGGSNASPALSSPVWSDESELETPLITVGVHGEPGTGGSTSRQAQKAKRFLRAKDKDLAQLKAQHERLHRPRSPSDSDLDDLWLDRTETLSAYYSSVPRSVCWVGLSLILIAVIVILYYARYEFNLIQRELPSEESLRHLQAEDSKSQAAAG